MKNYLKFIKSNHAADKGFTLIEILVAAAIMSIVVTLAGTAFVALLQQNQKAKAESDRRTNLNRALDYMANEIRMARIIQVVTPSPSSTSTPATTIPSGTGVLRLAIPYTTSSGTSYYDVVYYISNSSNGWENPNSINRYSNVPLPVPPTPTPSPSPLTSVPTPSPADNYFLVDGIKAPSSGTPTCPTPTPAPTPANQLVGSNGFYACIYSGGKKVDLYLYGKLSDEPRDPNYNKRLEVKSTVYTRAN
jgi:prepilin-type N-terminal cleavage/methylation domain-containing protein